MAVFPYCSWLYVHRPHMPEGPFTAKLMAGGPIYVLDWELSLVNWMVFGSWTCAAITSLMARGLYQDEARGYVSERLIAAEAFLVIAATIIVRLMP